MKRIFIAFMATVALMSCSKNDNNDPIQESAFVKKITETYPNSNKSTVTVYDIQKGKILSFTRTKYQAGVQTGTTKVTKIEYDGNRIKQMKGGEATSSEYQITDYHYDGQGLLVKQTSVRPNEINAGAFTVEYNYDGGRVTKVTSFYPTTTYINGEEKRVNRYEEQELVYSGNTITVNETETYRDGNGQVVSGTDTHTDTTVYTFSNGNIMKKVEKNQTTEYKYDTNTNPMVLHQFIKVINPTYFLESSFGKNNLIETVQTYTYGGRVEVTTYTQELTYNDKGYPIMNKEYRQRDSEVKKLISITEYEY